MPLEATIVMPRFYKESFEPPTAERITRIIADLSELGKRSTGYGLYTKEICNCLSVGLLLAAVSVSTSLLELFIRDLAVAVRVLSDFEGNMQHMGRVERLLEEEKAGFSSMLKPIESTVILPEDVEALQRFYEETRIPFAHGLVRRLTSAPYGADMLNDMLPQYARLNGLEDQIENVAIGEIEFVVKMMNRYHPWLVRRIRQTS